MTVPAPGSLWTHWKGATYRVRCVARMAGTGAPDFEMVVYEDHAGRSWVRPLSEWYQPVPGHAESRFTPFINRMVDP